jgi:hypothetical protein
MAKRNAKKQATREEIESSDPVCRKLSLLADEADVLVLTQGADFDPDDELGVEYSKRLDYLPVLLAELTEYRILIVAAEERRPLTDEPKPPKGPTAHEGSPDAANSTETE